MAERGERLLCVRGSVSLFGGRPAPRQHARQIAVCVCLLVFATACPSAVVSSDLLACESRSNGYGGGGYYEVPGSAGVPMPQLLSVFARPRTPRDRLPGEDYSVLLANDSLENEHVEVASARLVLEGLGQRNLRVYIAPTTRGAAYLLLVGGFDYFCDGEFGWHFWNPDGPPRPYALGLIPDDVTEVHGTVLSRTYEAAANGNAFFFELPGELDMDAITSIKLIYDDGSMQELIAPGHR